MPHKNNRVNINLGSSSLLLIFVVLGLVSFAVLSFSSALSDKNMAQKNLDKSLAYYDACNIAQEKLERIDSTLYKVYLDSSSENEFMEKCKDESLYFECTLANDMISYIIPISEYQGLEVAISPTYPANSNDCLYSVNTWKLVYINEPNIDFSVNVIK